MIVHHNVICAPTSLVNPIGELVYLNNDVFISFELQIITKETQWLKSYGETTKRSIHELN